ncbi:MAG TPA: HEAT repeat domain-containing protein [Polyangiaceae bacterium]|jgi:hypothetical protein
MNRRHRTIATLAALASLAAGGALLARHHHTLSAPAWLAHQQPALTFVVNLPRGTEYVYDVAWRMTTDLHVPELAGGKAGAVHADVDLEGALTLRSYGKSGGAYLVGARLERLTRHRLEILGGSALPDDDAVRTAFEGREALLEIDPAGTVQALHFAKDAPPVWKEVMRTLFTDASMHVLANGQSSWTADELSSTGRGAARYEVTDASPPALLRTRTSYDSVAALPGRTFALGEPRVTARAVIELDPAGHVRNLDSHENVRVPDAGHPGEAEYASETSLALRLSDVRPFTPSEAIDLASLETRVPGEVVASADAERQMLEQRTAGLTPERMRSDLTLFALTGSLPGGSGWVMRASGVLKLHPEACMDLAALFEEDSMNGRSRAQILDLLAGTGTAKAQDAMRVALESAAARKDGSGAYGALLQRFSAVARPGRDTIDFLATSYAAAPRGGERWAAAYALGAVAGNTRAGGDLAAARAASDPLRRDLANAETGPARKNLCAALGNAGDPADAPTFAALATDADAGVRAAAAWALRKIDTPEARQASLTFATDADDAVARSAFDALRYQTLEDDDLTSLARQVTQGKTPAGADGSLVTLLAAHTDGGGPVHDMLTALLAREDSDNTMEAEIRHLLARVR